MSVEGTGLVGSGRQPPLNPLDLPHQKLPTRPVLSGRQGERPPVGGELDGRLGQLLFEPPGNRLKGMSRRLEVGPSGSYVPLPLCRRAQGNAAP